MKSRTAGFTLVEALVALTLLSLMLTLLFSGLYTAGKNLQAGERQAAANDNQRLALSLLRSLVEQTVPLFLAAPDKRPQLVFKGERSALYFVSPLPSHRGGSGLYALALELEQDDPQDTFLALRYQPLNPAADLLDFSAAAQAEHIESQRLADGVTSIAFSYFGRRRPREAPHWRDSWDAAARLPLLIRVRVEASGYWPELVIPTRNKPLPRHPQLTLYAPQFLAGAAR